MDPAAAGLLRHFVAGLGGEVVASTRRGSGRTERWETTTEVSEVVTRVDVAAGEVELDLSDGRHVRLHLGEEELLRLLDGAGADGTEAWGEPLGDEEAAARFLTVFLDESLAEGAADPSGWWEFEDAAFVPVPPWEAHARRRRQGR